MPSLANKIKRNSIELSKERLNPKMLKCNELNDIDESKKSELVKLLNKMVFKNNETDFANVVEHLKNFNWHEDDDACTEFIYYVNKAKLDNFKETFLSDSRADALIIDFKDFILKRRQEADIAHNHLRYNSRSRSSMNSNISTSSSGKIRKKSKRGKGKKTSLRKEKRKNGKTRGKKKKN